MLNSLVPSVGSGGETVFFENNRTNDVLLATPVFEYLSGNGSSPCHEFDLGNFNVLEFVGGLYSSLELLQLTDISTLLSILSTGSLTG